MVARGGCYGTYVEHVTQHPRVRWYAADRGVGNGPNVDVAVPHIPRPSHLLPRDCAVTVL